MEADSPITRDIRETDLDEETLDLLFRDLKHCTQLLAIIPKTQDRRLVENSQGISLDQAKELICEKAVRGVQIRYLYDGSEWWDTIMLSPDGVKLFRICQDT